MSILAPCIGLVAFFAAVIALCFHLDAERVYRLGWKHGWVERGRQARQWLRNSNTP